MKTFKNPISATIELVPMGYDVIRAQFRVNLPLDREDAVSFRSALFDKLFQCGGCRCLSLFDDSCLLVPVSFGTSISADTVASDDSAQFEWDDEFVFSDGLSYSVHIRLNKSSLPRYDYYLGMSRTIVLRGDIEVSCPSEEGQKDEE